MKVSLVRRAVAAAALALGVMSAQVHAATLAFEALYDPSNGNISIRPFDSDTSSPWVGTATLGLVDLRTTTNIFTGADPVFPSGAFTTNTDTQVSWALLGSTVNVTYDAPYDLGNIAVTGLSQGDINTDFFSAETSGFGQFDYGVASGGAIVAGPVTAVPEPSTLAALAFGGIAGCTFGLRRRSHRVGR